MRTIFRFLSLAVLAMVITFLNGCYSDNFEPEPIIVDPGDPPVSFMDAILPVFESSCTQSICHATGAASPDLTPANAYNNLKNGGYINTEEPTQSLLYLSLTGEGGQDIMPPSGRNEDLIQDVVVWMSQGAENN
jgi:hypothetical protein